MVNYLRDKASDLLRRISFQKRLNFRVETNVDPYLIDETDRNFRDRLRVALTQQEIAQIEGEILKWAKDDEPCIPQWFIDRLIYKVNLKHI